MTPEVEKPFVPDAALQAALDAARGTLQDRSFSQRNPELGRMIKCTVCGRRHREVQQLFTHGENDGVKKASKFVGSVTCTVVQAVTYITEELNEDTNEFEITREGVHEKDTLKGVVGAAAFKGKRKSVHANQRNLLLIELTQEYFPNYEDKPLLFPDGDVRIPTAREAMFAARREAALILRRGIRDCRNKKNAVSKMSRRINRGQA